MNLEYAEEVLNNTLYDLEEFKGLITSGRWAAYTGLNETQVAKKLETIDNQIAQIEGALEKINGDT